MVNAISFVGKISLGIFVSFCFIFLPFPLVVFAPACSGLALLACGFFFVFVYPFALAAAIFANYALLSRYFKIDKALIYASLPVITAIFITFIVGIDAFGSLAQVLFVSFILTLLFSITSKALLTHIRGRAIYVICLLLPVLFFSPWIFHKILLSNEEKKINQANETTAIQKIPFNPYIAPNQKTVYVSSTDMQYGDNNEQIVIPNIKIRYAQFELREYQNTLITSAYEICNYSYEKALGTDEIDLENRSPNNCKEIQGKREDRTLAVSGGEYIIATKDVVIYLNLVRGINDANNPNHQEIIDFANSLEQINKSMIQPVQ